MRGPARAGPPLETVTGLWPALFLFGLIFWGIWQIFQGDWADGLWIAFVGWFIEQAATQSVARVALKDTLAGHAAREAMMSDCPHVPPAMTIQKLVDDVVLSSGRRCFPVIGGARVTGLTTLNEVRAVPQDRWATTTVGTAMIPLKELKAVSPDTGLSDVFEQLTQADVNQLPVMENGQLVGMIARDNILAFLQTRAPLGV